MAVVDELLAIGEEDRRKKQFLQDNPLFGMEPYHEVRPTYSNRYTETLGSLLEPLMTKPDAGPLDINFWTGLLSTPLVKSMRPREEPTKMEYAFSGVPFTPGLGVAPSLGRAAAKRFVPEFDPSRRQFLKTSATVGALTGLGIPLAKKALTKSTGAIESLASTLKDKILNAETLGGVNEVLTEPFYSILRKVAARERGLDKTIKYPNDELEATGFKFDEEFVHPVNEHIGTGRYPMKGIYSQEENVMMPETDYTKKINPSGKIKEAMDEADEFAGQHPSTTGGSELYSWESDGGDWIYGVVDEEVENVHTNKQLLEYVLPRLHALEKYNPKELVRMLDEEIEEFSRSGVTSQYMELSKELRKLRDKIAKSKPTPLPKPKKKDDVSIVQRVLDPLGYTRIKAPYEK